MTRISLKSRPLDMVYFVFFLFHLPATLFMDCQALYPPSLVPEALKNFSRWYVAYTGDALIASSLGLVKSEEYGWFKSFLFLELFFQVPVFILGSRGLWKGSRSIYVLILAYGASTATTTLPCVMYFFNAPSTTPKTIADGTFALTAEQKFLLLSSYIPFFFMPLVMAVDMSVRIWRLLSQANPKLVENARKVQ